jgi:hypothetical protein
MKLVMIGLSVNGNFKRMREEIGENVTSPYASGK